MIEFQMMGRGRMIKRMGQGFIYISMEQNILALGEMIYNMAKVSKHGIPKSYSLNTIRPDDSKYEGDYFDG
jgi:hypothetical protein